MRKLAVALLCMVFLTGCLGKNEELDRAMELRAKLLAGSCTLQSVVTADYGDKVYTFEMYCEADSKGNVGFRVTSPETIAGIEGKLSSEGGKLVFDDTALAFPLLADDQVTPVSAPYLLIKTLRGGYVRSAGEEDGLVRVTIDDSYEEDALQLDIWLDDANFPIRAEVLYDGRRILSMDVTDFQIS